MQRALTAACLLINAAWMQAAAAEPSKFNVEDLVRIANLTDLDLAPDGEYIVYSVGEPEIESDQPRYDVWRALGR